MRCDIRQYGDETRCEWCGLRWDTNDSDSPPCPYPNSHRNSDEGGAIGIVFLWVAVVFSCGLAIMLLK